MIFVQTKKVWLVGLGQEGFERGLGGNYLKYLKRGGTERRGGNRKIFKKGGKLGQGVGALKRRGGAESSLTNYVLQISYFLELRGEINEIYLN